MPSISRLDPCLVSNRISSGVSIGGSVANKLPYFYTWLNELLANPIEYGIPKRYVGDITNLFSEFLKHSSSADTLPSLLSVRERENDTNQPEVDPVTVHFGPNHDYLEIIDGAAALGYLFSIVSPPRRRRMVRLLVSFVPGV